MTTHLVSRIKQRGPLHVALSNVRRIEPHTPGAVLSAPTPTNRPAPFSIGYRSGGGFPWRLNGDVIGCLSEFHGKSNVINRTDWLVVDCAVQRIRLVVQWRVGGVQWIVPMHSDLSFIRGLE